MTTNSEGGGKPRGMAVARQRAREDVKRGAKLWECPYKAPAWRSVWLREYEAAQQMHLFT